MVVKEKVSPSHNNSSSNENNGHQIEESKQMDSRPRSKWMFLKKTLTNFLIMILLFFIFTLGSKKSPPLNVQPHSKLRSANPLHHGLSLVDFLNQRSNFNEGAFNSFKIPKQAFMVKLKVKYLVNKDEISVGEPVQVLHMGETPFRKSFLNNSEIGLKYAASSNDYLNYMLQSQPISLNGEVIFSKYPVVREPPGSSHSVSDLLSKGYIFEFVGVCRHRLLQRIMSQENLILSQIAKQSLVSWLQGSKLSNISKSKNKPPQYELINIVNNGPPENRIDVVFMGDGYTADEREKFIDDITRLSSEMFEGETFSSWLPLINVWAVFVPSSESGIGSGGKPKKTPFGLYRDGTELRGIYSSKPDTARLICNHLGFELCDFPSMIANDDFYGGLGGEYIISTRSILSGTVVLRHEMGHTFNEVGEEYDGGEVYEGANASPKLNEIPWKHWLTDFSHDHQVIDLKPKTKIKEEKNALAVQDYSWHDLTKKGPYALNFNSTGKYSRWYIQISTSGMDKEGSFRAYLDDVELPWKAPGTIDRTFSTWFNGTHGLSKGSHQLRFEVQSDFPEGKIINQLCNVEMMEYAKESKFGWDDVYRVGAYPTYNYQKKKTYRPTNEFCLMRNMTSQHFCPVCTESLWLKFLDRVSLIDDFDIHMVKLPKSHVNNQNWILNYDQSKMTKLTEDSLASIVSKSKDPKFTLGYYVEAKLINLTSSKHNSTKKHSKLKPQYHLRWTYNGNVLTELNDEISFIVPDASPYSVGIWEVNVQFSTPQVRKDVKNLLTSKQTFILKQSHELF